MKKSDLLEMLADLPDDADIRIMRGDDMLGDYHYDDFVIHEEEAREDKKGTLWAPISNYYNLQDKVKLIWVVE